MANEKNARESVTPASSGVNWRTKAYLIGVILGLLLGLLSAYLYVRAAQENAKSDKPRKVKTGDAMKLTLAILALVRQIAELGGKS
jgi:NhaP-type Na+/H+ or K+/H+ antiporter